MSVEHIEVIVEEPSMETALRALLPRIVGNVSFEVYRHLSKDELLERLPSRLCGYAKWLPANWRVVVVVDRDDDDCHELKARLEKMAADANLLTRTAARGQPHRVVNRLAIEELEAWYFGEWDAVRIAYPRLPGTIPARKGYRDPDAIKGGTWEALERIMLKSGYFRGGLRKIELAGMVAPNMDPARNASSSFKAFSAALADMVQ